MTSVAIERQCQRSAAALALLSLFVLAAGGCEIIAGTKNRKVGTAGTAGIDGGPGTGGTIGTDGPSATGDSPLGGEDMPTDAVRGTGGAGGGTGGAAGTGGAPATGGSLGADGGPDLPADAPLVGNDLGARDLAGTGGFVATGGIAGRGGATGTGGVSGTGGVIAVGGAGTGGAGGAGAGGAGTGGGATDASADVGDAVPRMCDVTRPFGTPVLLAGVDGPSGADGTARLSPDELTAYFFSDRTGTGQIYVATRASRSAAFGTPQLVGGGIGNVLDVLFPTVTADGLGMYVESDPGGVYQVMVSSRSSLQVPFAPVAPATINSASGISGQPFVLPDGSAIYFISDRPGSFSSLDIYRAGRDSSGQFGLPALVSTVNTTAGEYSPVPTPDELVLYFSSDRSGATSKGGLDIWMTKRAATADGFDPPVNVQELNSGEREWPDWVSPDRCRLYFDRQGSSGWKIYVAERSL